MGSDPLPAPSDERLLRGEVGWEPGIGDILKHHGIDGVILHAYRGSIAHGMHVPGSDPNSIDDIDTMAVVVPDLEHYYGLREFGSRGTVEIKEGEYDIVVYEARKTLSLLAKGNPNMLSLLWVHPRFYLHVSNAGRVLLENRHVFGSKHAFHSFSGYAEGQMKAMQRGVFNGYMGERRKRLVDEFGYDTKNAAHLIRLLRMGTEFLNTGVLSVWREGIDADELLAVKVGEWSLEQVQAEAEKGFAAAREAFEKSELPERVDMDAVNALCTQIVAAVQVERLAATFKGAT